MTRSDSLDGSIREALAEVVAHAPLTPDFEELSGRPGPDRSRRLPLVTGFATVVVVAAVLAVLAMNIRDDDATVGKAGPPTAQDADASNPDGAPTTAPEATAIPESTLRMYAAVQAAVIDRLPAFPSVLDVSRGTSSTTFEFGSEVDAGTFSLDVYEAGAFIVSEMEALPELKAAIEEGAWLGADDPDLRSVYYLSADGTGLRVASNAPGTSESLSINDLVAAAADLASDSAVIALAAQSDGIALSVTLWHCGVEPVTVNGRDWEVPDTETVDGHPDLPLDSTNTPADWVGRGTAVIREDSMTYTDAGGEVVGFVPDDGQPPGPCA